MTSSAAPSAPMLPDSIQIARPQSAETAVMLWLTKRTVRPAAATSSILPRQLLLERRVADREDLVDEEDLGLEVRGDREGQPHVHAARVVLDRSVDELLDLRERTISSKRWSISRVRMPRIAPFR